MRLPFFVVLVVSCRLSTSIGIYNREDVGFRSSYKNDAEFFDRVGDWFRHVKQRIYERFFEPATIAPPPPPSTEPLDLDRFDLRNRLMSREKFLIDLATLSFDPEEDWGFRVGNWYFIRKGGNNRNGFNKDPGDWEMHPASTVPPFMDQGTVISDATTEVDNTKDPGFTIPSTTDTSVPTMTYTVMQSVTRPITQTNIPVDSFEGFSTGVEKHIEDNETDNDVIHKGSVEVIMG